MRKIVVLSTVISVLLLCSIANSAPALYFADDSGTPITQITASVGEEVVVYIYGQTDAGNPYDYFNLGLMYDPLGISPRTGVATSDLVMSTDTTFGSGFGHQITTYQGVSLLNAAATDMGNPPEGFDATLLATAHFTFLDGPTEISMFNEAGEYTYSTYFMDTLTLEDFRFAGTGTVTIVPEPMTVTMLAVGALGLIKRRYGIITL